LYLEGSGVVEIFEQRYGEVWGDVCGLEEMTMGLNEVVQNIASRGTELATAMAVDAVL